MSTCSALVLQLCQVYSQLTGSAADVLAAACQLHLLLVILSLGGRGPCGAHVGTLRRLLHLSVSLLPRVVLWDKLAACASLLAAVLCG